MPRFLEKVSRFCASLQKLHTPITKNDHASISASIIDEGFKKLEPQIYELNKSVNSELALLNRRLDSFSDHFNKLVNSSLPSQNEKFLEENIYLLKKKPLYERRNNQETR